jgi:hypothetical protein
MIQHISHIYARYDIAEIRLKLALNTNQPVNQIYIINLLNQLQFDWSNVK